MYFHGNNFNSLHKHISPSILPKYFNGTLEFDPITWVQQFLTKENYFEGKIFHYNILLIIIYLIHNNISIAQNTSSVSI